MKVYGAVRLGVVAVLVAGTGSGVQAQDESRRVEGGGIHVQGWAGRIDAGEAGKGLTLEDARLASADGGALHVTTGPAVAYWNAAHTAAGDYTVSATFTEREYMALNDHPHPYGIFIAGSGMGTDQQKYLYCSAYGSGTFIVRGFGPAPFQLNGRRPEAHDAINKAAGRGQPVTQQIALSVRGGRVECSVNGTVVGSYDRSDALGEGKLDSTDGVYGVRFGHNTEAIVEGLTLTRH
jgi:hypothetical protein